MNRFSLRSLGAAIAIIAASCASLTNANPWIASTAWTLIFVLLALATIAAVLSSSDRRGFWTGFAIVGWLYLLIGIGPLFGYYNGSLITTAALHRAAALLSEEEQVAADVDVAWSPKFGTTMLTKVYDGQTRLGVFTAEPSQTEPAQSFVSIGQALWTLLLALLGGWFGAFIAARRN